jgi:membrane protease YdiL (CAAX protease family)
MIAILIAVRRRQVLSYFVAAYVISWAIWLPRVATAQGWWQIDVPEWWHYAGAAGPISAALLVSFLAEGRAGVRSLLSHYSPSRVRWPWLAFAVLGPLVLLGTGLAIARLLDGAWPTFRELSRTSDLPAMVLPLTLLVHIMTFGIGEETGWRGFALPRLQVSRTAIQATHLLAIAWGLWHVPAFFEDPFFMDMAPAEIVGWAAGLWLGAAFLTWLFNSSCGSLIVVVLWHGLFNQFSASEASSLVAAVISAGVMVTAIVALRLAGPRELTGLSHEAGARQRHGLRAGEGTRALRIRVSG